MSRRAANLQTEPRSTDMRRPGAVEFAFLFAAGIFGLVYYRDAYRLGFDWGDMGSYAQYVRELMLGAKFGDAVGYGPLWYFLGVGLFRVWGVHFGALLAMFQIVIFASACLIWLAARKASNSAIAAGIALIWVLCVPPFYASAIRMLSLALFAYPLICFAKAEKRRELWPLAATAAAIGINFALRPDFGYLYTAALGILLLLRAWQSEGSLPARLAYLLRLIGVSTAFIGLALAPIVLHAAFQGYLKPLLTDLLSYPSRLLFFLRHAGGFDDLIQDSGRQTASFLRILPAGALITGTAAERAFAFQIYSTLAVLIGFGLHLAYRLVSSPNSARDNRIQLSVLMIAASQWPGFALFRPDWVHFISFMHAYIILATCMAVWLIRNLLSAAPAMRLLQAAGVVLVAAQAVLFVIYGVFVDDSGWGRKQAHRDAVFSARNGVRQLVSADEKKLYDDVFELIEHNSSPGDRIVCVPYCAGFAFMTDRRVLFREHYVDDGTPLLYPGWIDRAIALTKEVRPPIVIVLDWAPNGTAASRFDVWAERYMAYIKQTYARAVPFAMGTIWFRDAAPSAPAQPESILAYGPQKATLGTPFNRQPGGESAIWIKLSVPARIGATIQFDERPLKTVIDGVALSALVPADMLTTAGTHWLKVVNSNTGLMTDSVSLEIMPPP